jgi:hypothetical protein
MQQRKKSSPAQAAAARSNGAKSAGPKSAAGKQNSSRNSLKHGITCTTRTPLLLPGEDEAVLQKYTQAFYDHFRPSNLAEGALVDTLISLVWKTSRIHGYEAENLTSTAEDIHPTLAAQYESIGINRLFAIAFENPPEKQNSPLALRYLIANRNMFRSALSDFVRLRQAKADPEQPCIPVPQFAPVIRSFCIDSMVLPVTDLNTPVVEPATGFAAPPEHDLPDLPPDPMPEVVVERAPEPSPHPPPSAVPATPPSEPVSELEPLPEPPMIPLRDGTGAIYLNMAGDPMMKPNPHFVSNPNKPHAPVPHYKATHFPNDRFNTKLVPGDPRFSPQGYLRNEPEQPLNPCRPILPKAS